MSTYILLVLDIPMNCGTQDKENTGRSNQNEIVEHTDRKQ